MAEIDEYVIDIAKRFRFVMVSYDAFNSISSIQKLRSKGIPSKLTEFRPKYKMKIYQHLEHLLVSHSLALPSISSDAQLLIQELKHLKRIYNATGFRIKPDPEAAVKTDDVIDGLVGACGTATETIYQGYAKGTTAYLPQSQSAGAEQWKVGRGVYNNQTWKNTFRR